MDDILCGAGSVDEAIILRDQLINILHKASFNLSKWASNESQIVKEQGNPSAVELEKSDTTKVLGLLWNPQADHLCYRIQKPNVPDRLAKRAILSCIARLYDPLGIIAPVIVKAKILMQSLWALKLGWDDPVHTEVRNAWLKFVD